MIGFGRKCLTSELITASFRNCCVITVSALIYFVTGFIVSLFKLLVVAFNLLRYICR